MIWGSAPEDRPYSSRIYDPFWQAASELEMPLSLHVITGRGRESKLEVDPKTGNIVSLAGPTRLEMYANVIHEIQRSLTSLIVSGVLERFPRLKPYRLRTTSAGCLITCVVWTTHGKNTLH